MLRPRWIKIWRDLWLYRARTLLVILSIAVGVFAVGMIAGAWQILAQAMPASYAASQPASAVLFTANFDETLLQAISRLNGVAEAVGRRSLVVRLSPTEPASAASGDTLERIELIALASYKAIPVNRIATVAGASAPAAKAILLERATVPALGSQIGDGLTVETGNELRRTLKVSGVVYDPSLTPPTFSGIGSGFINGETLEWLGEPRAYNQLYFTVSENPLDRQHIQTITNRVRRQLSKAGVKVFAAFVPTPGEHPNYEIVQAVLLVLALLGVTALLASSFLVINTISAVITQQTRQIGVMKALGADARQLGALYRGMVVIYGVIAIGLAMPLATIGAQQLAGFVAGLLNFDLLDVSLAPWIYGLEVALGLLTPLLASWLPIRHGARMSVRAALDSRAAGAVALQAGWLERGLARLRFLSRPFLLALRNTFRRKGRLVLSLLTLTLGGAICIAIFSIYNSLQRTVEEAGQSWQYDLAVYFERDVVAPKLQQLLTAAPGVVASEAWYVTSTRRTRPDGLESDDIEVIGLPAESALLQAKLVAGRWLQAEDRNAIVINTQLLDNEPDLQVGSVINVKLNERKQQWRIVGITRGALDGQRIYINDAPLLVALRRVGQTNNVRLRLQPVDLASPEQATAQVSALESYLKSRGLRIGFVQTTADQRAQVEFQFGILLGFLAIMAVLVLLVGAIGLMGTMSINVLERVAEIGILRAVGASNWAILRIFLGEGLVIGLLGWLLGVPLALPLSRYLSDEMGYVLLQTPLNYEFSWRGAGLSLLFILSMAMLATYFPARGATRLSVRQTLAYE